ncbi:hypothetical protein D3C71_1619180 [compost metagenome]
MIAGHGLTHLQLDAIDSLHRAGGAGHHAGWQQLKACSRVVESPCLAVFEKAGGQQGVGHGGLVGRL